MTKFKTLRGLAGYLVRQEGKMTAKKSRAKIGDTVQMLGVLSDRMFDDYVDDMFGGDTARAYPYVSSWGYHFVEDFLIQEGAKRWKRAQKVKK
jgi:hypothetical protein